MTNLLKNRVADSIAALFILLFAYTAMNKIMHYENFILTLSRSPLIAGWSQTIGLSIIMIEMLLVLFLFFPSTRTYGLLFSAALMFLFTVYVGYMIIAGSRLPCSCGGIIQQLSWRNHFVLNIVLTLLSCAGFYFRKFKSKLNTLLQ